MIKWIEMKDLMKVDYNKTSWIPLCAAYDLIKEGKSGYAGYKNAFFCAVSIIFSEDEKEKVFKLKWEDVNLSNDNSPLIEDKYYCAGTYFNNDKSLKGEYPVLQQYFETGETKEWNLSQDIVLALGLKRENDVWVRPSEDYIEVARLIRSGNNSPQLLEIRTEHLKDYLCARESCLLVYTYQDRNAVVENFNYDKWVDGKASLEFDWGLWEGSIIDIAEGGQPYGSSTAVFHMSRTDIDKDDDNPILLGMPTDNNMKSEHWEIKHTGKKLQSGFGRMWKKNWITPAKKSSRVRGDMIESNIEFIIGVDGEKAKSIELEDEEGRWLWFKPDVIKELLKRPMSVIEWYTEDTGKVGTSNYQSVHFGMNSAGLINVYAEDISRLSAIQQAIWASYNITPDAKVSRELLMSQVDAEPADTSSPEYKLYDLMEIVDRAFLHKYGSKLFLEHDLLQDYWKLIHRFQSTDFDGFLKLAKDLTRLVVERIDLDFIKKITPTLRSDYKSIKRIEHLLDERNTKYKGRKITACLVGINDLRQLDAHLPSGTYDEALKLIDVKISEPFPLMGKEMIDNVARSLWFIYKSISEGTNTQLK